MVDKNKEATQLVERSDESAVALTEKQLASLYKKSKKSGYSLETLEEVYNRGVSSWNESTNQTPEQYGFGRVNSFIAGGHAMKLDKDLVEKEVWDEPNPKEGKSEKLSSEDKAAAKARAARAGRKYPNLVDNMWAAQRNEETCMQEPQSEDSDDSSSRFEGTDSLVGIYKGMTPGQSNTFKAIKDVVRDIRESEELSERATSRAQQRLMGAALAYKRGESDSASDEVKRLAKNMSEKELEDFARTKHKGLPERVEEETLEEATYKGKKVKLNKPFRTSGGKKKFAVYVDPDGDGKAQIVRFGDPNMSIKKDQPGRKKSYCARSKGIGKLNDKTSANYWSRKMWDC
jgi:hypothetical protein